MQSDSSDAAGFPEVGPSDANGAASSASSSPTPPRIPDYELLRRIGGGSYGEVWLGRNALGTWRAIKVVYRKTFDTDRPYEREFGGIQKFEPISRSHDNLIDVLHVGRNDDAGYFYYVMELADDAAAERSGGVLEIWGGGTTQRSITPPLQDSGSYVPHTLKHEMQRRGRLPFEECLQLGLALTSALAHLHKNGLAHRDIKPSNIIFVGAVPKLADIGLVAGLDEARSYVGTEGYIPPEGPGTAPADLYSLGKVLYELSTGKDRQHFPEPLTELGELGDASRLLELNAVIHKACRANVADRYPSADAMHADLSLLQSGQSIRRLRVVERRLALLTRAGLFGSSLLAIAAVAYVVAVSQARRSEQERARTEQLLYAADMSLAQQALEAGNIARATMLLEGHRPGAKSKIQNPKSQIEHDLRGFEWFYLKNLCRSEDAHTFLGHGDAVTSVAISPDGQLLASGSADQTIKLWDFNSKSNIVTLKAHAGAVNTLAFSPDGTKLASGGADKAVKLWDVATLALVANWTNPNAPVTTVAFSGDGKRLAAGTDGRQAKLWDLATGKEVHEFKGNEGAAKLVAFSPDGKLFATGVAPPSFGVTIWDPTSLECVAFLHDQAGGAWGMAFSADSKVLAVTRSDGVVLFDLANGSLPGKLKGHDREVLAVAFSPDRKTLASGSGDCTVRLWDFETQKLLRVLKGHTGPIASVAFSADGRFVVSGSGDRTVRLWEISAPKETETLRGHTDAVNALAFSPDDKMLATAGADRSIKLWDPATGATLATLAGHSNAVTGVRFSADGVTLVSCGLDKTIRVWDVRSHEAVAVLAARQKLSCLALAPDGRTLVTGSGWWDDLSSPCEISLWDFPARRVVTNLTRPAAGMVRMLEFLPGGRTLGVGYLSDSVSLELLAVPSMQPRFASTNLGEELAFSPDGRTMAVPDATDMDRITLFDIVTRRVSGRLQLPGTATRYYMFSPDGKTLAVWYANGKIKLCDVASGREVVTLEGHDTFGMYLAFSHDGQTLATASNDGTVRLWRAPRNEVAPLEMISRPRR